MDHLSHSQAQHPKPPPTKPAPSAQPATRRHRWIWLKYVGVLSLFGAALACYHAYEWYQAQPWDEQIHQILNYDHPQSTRFFDSSGQLIAQSYAAHRRYTPLDNIPASLVDAVIAIEDKNFYRHRGVDIKAIVRAAWANFKAQKITQGGSTITQQVVRFHLLNREKTMIRKLKEAILAWRLEQAITKDEILEMYLNHLFMGQNAYGVASIALRLFSKPLHQLGIHEHALIAGLFQAPSRYNPLRHRARARKRQLQVLQAMKNTHKISAERFEKLRKQPLRYRFHPGQTFTSHHMYTIDYARLAAEKILGETDLRDKGYAIYTTLQRGISNLVNEAITNMNPTFNKIERLNADSLNGAKLQAAVIILNLHSGTIAAMIGGRSYAHSHFNRTTQAQRSPGSLFKPVIYSFALLNGYRWSDVFYLAPITLNNTYRPRSNESEYLGETTLLRAFTQSINVTTVEVGKKLGMNRIIEYAQQLGIRSPIKQEYGSLIGQSEVRQLDILRMYSTFANGGKMIEPTIISHIVDANGDVVYRAPSRPERESQVIPAAVNFLMVKAMSSVLRHGTARSAAHLSHIAAGKTGTSNDAVDNWFSGFTSKYLTVVWVGPDTTAALPHGRVAGATLALPIWTHITEALHQNQHSQAFARPEGVHVKMIDGRYGHTVKLGYEAWFLAHHQPPSQPSFLKLTNLPGRMLRGFGGRP